MYSNDTLMIVIFYYNGASVIFYRSVEIFRAGMFSGFVSAFFVTPVERIKCLLQVMYINWLPLKCS